jgi:molybdate transport system ATP-binding protein
MPMNPFLLLSNVIPRMVDNPFVVPVDWELQAGEVWSITGDNGSGKSLLAAMIAGKLGLQQGTIEYPFLTALQRPFPDHPFHPWEKIRLVSFNAAYSLADFRTLYYQQRFHHTETDDSPLVRDLISLRDQDAAITAALQIHALLDKRLIQLSSGELRKLLIAKAMMDHPAMMIFDNPFIGLDAKSQTQLDELFTQMHQHGVPLLFLSPSRAEMPSCTTHVLKMNRCEIVDKASIEAICAERSDIQLQTGIVPIDWNVFGVSEKQPADYEVVVQMENVDIAYGKQLIRQGVNWTLRKGEKWALLGPNGSGKSTLLSYIFADNPQAYAKKMILFDRRRGSGESIWEIKARIGFTSSEMHLYYRENVSCLSVVASGFFDSIGLYRKCSEKQLQKAELMLQTLACSPLKSRSFLKISSGEQRLVLFARALIKNPDLLILDEPFHGLDAGKKLLCRHIVEQYASQPDKSLIYVTHQRNEIPVCVQRFMELG